MYLCQETYYRYNNMALPIASIPVLTGEVARRFEAEAQANYERVLNRTPEEREAARKEFEKRMEKLHRMLAKSHLGRQ